jgi:transcription termination/antitermination protein NusG
MNLYIGLDCGDPQRVAPSLLQRRTALRAENWTGTRESVSYMLSTAISEGLDEGVAIHRAESWFALVTRPRHEKVVSEALNSKGLKTFLPLVQRRHQYGRRSRAFDVPLFPGYLFCRFNVLHRLPVIMTPGIVRIVGAGPDPIPVSEVELASLQIAMRERIPVHPHAFLHEGARVAVTDGPLAGLEGIVVKEKDPVRIVISIGLLQRSVLLEIAADRVGAPCSNSDSKCYDYR